MHFDSEKALDLVDGTMSDAERRFWNKHLENCIDCNDDLVVWKSLTVLLRGDSLVDAPEDAIVLSKGIFDKPRKTMEVQPLLQQVIATVIFDSSAQPAFAGIREIGLAGQATVRQMVLRAADFDVRIRVSSFEDRRDLLGQILPLRNANLIHDARVHLRKGEDRVGTAKANDMGEFQFDDVPQGMLSLQIDLPRLTVISALTL